MKKVLIGAVRLSVLLGVVLLLGCAGFRGRAYETAQDGTTIQPIQNASISFSRGEYRRVANTRQDGQYKIYLPRLKKFRVSASHPAYDYLSATPESPKTPWFGLKRVNVFMERNTVAICVGGNETIVIIVDPALVAGIRSSVDQFESDLCAAGYSVEERTVSFANPADVRSFLRGIYYATNENLVGAILIGDQPYAYQFVTQTYANPDLPPYAEEIISMQYFSDLDGTFDTSTDYVSPGGHSYSYDIHDGEVDWEIWIGLLPMYKGDLNLTTEAINRYFEKNHAYRMGDYSISRAFMEINEHHSASTLDEHAQVLQRLTTGTYAWTPFSSAPNSHIYFDSPPAGLSAAQGYASMTTGVADFVHGAAHGSRLAHGQISINWVESNQVDTVIFWSDGCSVGNIDYDDNFLTSILYSPTSQVLVAKGTTNNSGGMGTNQSGFFGHNIATSLSGGESVGQAMLDHVNVPLISPWSEARELHFAPQIILGDPTLTIQ